MVDLLCPMQGIRVRMAAENGASSIVLCSIAKCSHSIDWLKQGSPRWCPWALMHPQRTSVLATGSPSPASSLVGLEINHLLHSAVSLVCKHAHGLKQIGSSWNKALAENVSLG